MCDSLSAQASSFVQDSRVMMSQTPSQEQSSNLLIQWAWFWSCVWVSDSHDSSQFMNHSTQPLQCVLSHFWVILTRVMSQHKNWVVVKVRCNSTGKREVLVVMVCVHVWEGEGEGDLDGIIRMGHFSSYIRMWSWKSHSSLIVACKP